MPIVAAGIGLVSAGVAANQSGGGGGSSDAQIAYQQQMMQLIQKMMKPYREAGKSGLGGMLDLVGLSGADAQANAIAGLEKSPYFTSLVKTGENAILQNASATGGLRGGNTQAALAEFRPAMLSQAIENQYSKYADLATRGQNAAAQTGAGNAQYSTAIGNIMANQAQNDILQNQAQGQMFQDIIGSLGKMYGQYKGGTF